MSEEQGLTPYETREILFYKTENGEVRVEILLFQENLWLTQAKMAELFEVQKAAISKHLKKIFESGELSEDSVVSKMETTAADGKRMIEFIEQTYRDNFRILRVGTGDSQLTLPFYKKCGFIESHRIKNFFTDNYDHPIFECGVQLIDMVYLEKNLLWESNTIHRKK